MKILAYPSRSRSLLTAGILVGVAALVAIALVFAGRGPDKKSASTTLEIAIDEATAKLVAKPGAIESTQQKAMRVRNAIKQGDYATADRITADVLANSHLQPWRFYPFTVFITGVADVNDPSFEARLDAWVTQNRNSAIPVLVRAQYYYDFGWFKRGSGSSLDIQADNMISFVHYMNRATTDINASLHLNDENPYSFDLRLRILQGRGLSESMMSAFEEAIVKYPTYYQLFQIVLRTLEPKWGGSVEAMYAFVEKYAGPAPEYAPIKLLYLNLYGNILDSASVTCASYRRDQDKNAECVAATMNKILTRNLESQVLEALRLYEHSDKYQFGTAVGEILATMLRITGSDAYSGAILQLAAASMHSDTRLKVEQPANNSYIIDAATAESWYLKGFYDNALEKDRQALKDIEGTQFPGDEEKYLAIAEIYNSMARAYSKIHQHSDMIAYEKAAIALGSKTLEEHFICYGYYKLKVYDKAVRECTKIIDETGNIEARFWRARTYRDSGQTAAAVPYLRIVADSENGFRTSAAIDLSVILSQLHDDRGSLTVLNKYTYLYNLNTNVREDIAVSYNNRCYSHMQLGELKEALDDCTASLKYGSIPDAYNKQQELIRRLAAHEKSL